MRVTLEFTLPTDDYEEAEAMANNIAKVLALAGTLETKVRSIEEWPEIISVEELGEFFR
jgi:hypothetical protein